MFLNFQALDSIPWEMLDVLEDEPVSRLPSLHFVYFLFKAHEKNIEAGHKVSVIYFKIMLVSRKFFSFL